MNKPHITVAPKHGGPAFRLCRHGIPTGDDISADQIMHVTRAYAETVLNVCRECASRYRPPHVVNVPPEMKPSDAERRRTPSRSPIARRNARREARKLAARAITEV